MSRSCKIECSGSWGFLIAYIHLQQIVGQAQAGHLLVRFDLQSLERRQCILPVNYTYGLWFQRAPWRYGGSRPASQSRMSVEHKVRIRTGEEGHPPRGWAYFTYPAPLFAFIQSNSEFIRSSFAVHSEFIRRSFEVHSAFIRRCVGCRCCIDIVKS